MARFKKIGCVAMALSLLLGILWGCSPRQKKFQTTWFEWFDTFSTLTAYAESQEAFDRYATLCASYLEDYHQLLDVYHDYDGVNNLKVINDRAGDEVSIDPRLGEFLRFGQEVHELTGGAVNIGMGSALSLWNDAREVATKTPYAATLPEESALRDAMEHTELANMILSEDGKAVCLTDAEMSLNAGALGKGYVARLIADALAEAGCESFLLNLGGNTVARGAKPDGSAWLVGIESPGEGIEYGGSVRLNDRALVTSGSYQRYFTLGGVRYHHIVDAESGYPENRYLSVSILCPDSALADALSTALFCMTEEEGRALLDKVEDAEALWILANGDTCETDGWASHVQQGGAS